jgi:hypothetical protein
MLDSVMYSDDGYVYCPKRAGIIFIQRYACEMSCNKSYPYIASCAEDA